MNERVKSFEVLKEKVFDNKVVGRREVYLTIYKDKSPTPTVDEVRDLLSEKYDWSRDLIVVRKIRSYFGLPKFVIEAHLYYNKEDLLYFEPEKMLRKNKLVENGQEKENKEEG